MTPASLNQTLLDNRNHFIGLRHFFDRRAFSKLFAGADSIEDLVQSIEQEVNRGVCPPFVSELAAMEAELFRLDFKQDDFDLYPDEPAINPGLKIFSNSWKHLLDFCDGTSQPRRPESGGEQVMIWPMPGRRKPAAKIVSDEDLLVLKITVEQLGSADVAKQAGTYQAAINGALLKALEKGIILGPRPKLVRCAAAAEPDVSEHGNGTAPFTTARVFALQWHITQDCDLHCRHCYDRSPCPPLGLEREIKILDDLAAFCKANHVFGQVSFTGGNPLLHPNFLRLYREASERGFFLGILGNPAGQADIDALLAIQPPAFYQMSLEGLTEHNDYIRGEGHFQRVLDFLDLLRDNDIYSKIMLTLTRDNIDQVVELGTFLQDRTDLFTFNRLSLVGEGANLVMADTAQFRDFLNDYIEAGRRCSVFDLKDNLFNILLDERSEALFGGCTGYGCGAAFNFVSVLPSGEVHACRKFPSPIGNLAHESLTDIYHSERARAYRNGPEECSTCRLNPVCRGCLAASYSRGLDIFSDRDPYCFLHGD